MPRTGIPPVTKLVLSLLVVCSLVTFVLRYSTYIHLVSAEEHDEDHEHLVGGVDSDSDDHSIPGSSVEMPDPQDIYVPLIALVPTQTPLLLKPWTLVTSAFIEDGLLNFAISFFLILYTGRYIEVLWGSREFFYYLFTTVLVSNTAAYVLFGLQNLADDDARVLPITGTSAIVISLLVAIKQRIPNHFLLFLDGFVRLRVSFVPFMVLVSSCVLSFFIPTYKIAFVLSLCGFITSWAFLRFFKEGGSGRQLAILPISDSSISVQFTKGDRTSQFALSTFFPYPFSLVISFISNRIFDFLVKSKILKREDFTNEEDELENETVSTDMNQNDLISQMTQSRLFTSSSLAGVSGKISTFSLPKGSLLQRISDKFFSFNSDSTSNEDAGRSLDRRRKLALMQLDSKLGSNT